MARPSSCTVALLLGGLLGCSAQTSTGPSVVAASSDSLAEKRARAKQGVEDGVPGLALAPLPPTPRDARRQILKVCLYVVDGSLQRHSLADLLEVATRALNSGSSPRVDVTSSRLQQAQTALDSALIQASTRNPRISAAQLAQTAAVAVVDSLHDSSRYFSAEVLRRFSRKAEATFGMILGKADPYPVVLAVVPDSPAAAAGVQRGDELMEVEGRSTFRMDMLAVGAMLSGLTGSEATLRLAYGADSVRTVVLTRASLRTGPVRCRILDRQVLYLSTPTLSPTTAAQIRAAADSAGDMSRLMILDLRGNLGGLFESAVAIADLFLESGLIVRASTRIKIEDWRAKAGSSRLERSRVAVLVDEQTASGAELIAAALQDAHRAVVIGRPTFGAGDVGIWYALEGGAALRLAVARLARPNGAALADKVVPDMLVAQGSDGPPVTVEDVACPGTPSGAGIARDPDVARAFQELMQPPSPRQLNLNR